MQALSAARVTRPAEMNALLQEPQWQLPAGMFSFSTEVKLFLFISNVFSLSVASKIFALTQ